MFCSPIMNAGINSAKFAVKNCLKCFLPLGLRYRLENATILIFESLEDYSECACYLQLRSVSITCWIENEMKSKDIMMGYVFDLLCDSRKILSLLELFLCNEYEASQYTSAKEAAF